MCLHNGLGNNNISIKKIYNMNSIKEYNNEINGNRILVIDVVYHAKDMILIIFCEVYQDSTHQLRVSDSQIVGRYEYPVVAADFSSALKTLVNNKLKPTLQEIKGTENITEI